MSRVSQTPVLSKQARLWFIGLAVAAFVGGVVWRASVRNSVSELGQSFANQGQTHIADGAAHPAYNSFPATSGWHAATPQPWGVFSTEVPQEKLVHNLEHGGIVMQYNPQRLHDISVLLDLQRQFPNKTVVAPNSALKVPLALTAWRRLYTLETADRSQIQAFIQRYKDRAPERFPD